MDVDAFLQVLSPAGQRLLATMEGELRAGADTLALATRLRRDHPPALVAAALTQATLRSRARRKFGSDADRMYFTREGLEQATRARVAEHHARRFHSLAPSTDSVSADLCCGIGADMLALARSGWTVHGVERDQLTVAVARANAEALGLSNRTLLTCYDVTDVTRFEPGRYDAVFCDPSRRAGGTRVFDPAMYSPPLADVFRLASQVPAAALKVAPGIPHSMVPTDAEAEWVSDAGEVKEAALWFGALGRAGTRRATLLPSGANLTAPDMPAEQSRPPVAEVRRYLYEPDGAVIRGGLVAEVVALTGGALLDPSIAYVTSEHAVCTPFARGYEVTDVLPFSLKRLRAVLAARGVGAVTLKKRGSPVDVERLRGQLRLTGSESAVVVLTRLAGQQHALICEPMRGSGKR